MRHLTSVVAAGALALALAVPAPEVRASAPRAETVETGSWFHQLVAQLWGYFAGSATIAPSEQDTGPHMDPNGLTSPVPESADAGAASELDTGPDMDPDG